jgi:hypothetical protein
MQLLETVEVIGASVSSITFSAIAESSNGVYLAYSLRGDLAATSVGLRMKVNGLTTASGYTGKSVSNIASSQSAQNYTGNIAQLGEIGANSATASAFSIGTLYMFKTYGSNAHFIAETAVQNDSTLQQIHHWVGRTPSLTSNPIQSITLQPASGNFVQYSSVSLYSLS